MRHRFWRSAWSSSASRRRILARRILKIHCGPLWPSALKPNTGRAGWSVFSGMPRARARQALRSLEASQKREQCASIFGIQRQTEDMPRHGASRHTGWIPAFRLVVRTETCHIEHLFKTRHRRIVKQARPIPDAAQRGNLVEARSLAGLERETRIGSYRDGHNVVTIGMIGWRLPPLGERELSARVIRWHVTVHATFPAKDLFATRDELRRSRVRILRRLEGHQIQTDRMEHFIGVPEPHTPLRACQDVVGSEVHRI